MTLRVVLEAVVAVNLQKPLYQQPVGRVERGGIVVAPEEPEGSQADG